MVSDFKGDDNVVETKTDAGNAVSQLSRRPIVVLHPLMPEMTINANRLEFAYTAAMKRLQGPLAQHWTTDEVLAMAEFVLAIGQKQAAIAQIVTIGIKQLQEG